MEFAHAVLGTPGVSTTQRHCTTSIQASLSFPTVDQLTSNIAAAYKIDRPPGNQVIGLVCMIDEIKVEEMLDWCPSMNSMIRLCQEHLGSSVHIFNNIDNVHVLFDNLAKNQVHFGTEVHLTHRTW